MRRTTIELNEELFRKAKRKASDEGIPLRELVERALRAHLEQRQSKEARRYRLRLKTQGGGLRPGVSLEDWNALRDVMDDLD
jgi:hypothetical protein